MTSFIKKSLAFLFIFSTHAAEITPSATVTYKKIGNVELKLHAFHPDGYKPSDSRPAVVFFFGGGWVSGDPKQFYPQAKALADKGMVTFSAEYRIAKKHKTTPFECVKDGKSAVRYIRAHAAELGVNPDQIIAAGGSAGGHVAACTALIEGAEEAGEDLKISSVPNALMLFNPVLDTTKIGYGSDRFKSDQITAISPCHHVRKGIVPTIVFHGTADTTVPFENATRFTNLMKEAGNHAVLAPFKGKGHGFFNLSIKGSNRDDYDQVMKLAQRFLKDQKFLP